MTSRFQSGSVYQIPPLPRERSGREDWRQLILPGRFRALKAWGKTERKRGSREQAEQ
jgi:hypothetical protein